MNFNSKHAFVLRTEDGSIFQRVISPPSPPRSGGEGRGEVVLGEQGHEVSASCPNTNFGNYSKSKPRNCSFVRAQSRRAFTLLEVMLAVGILFMCLFGVLALTSNSLASARKLQQHKDLDAGTFESMIYMQLVNTNQIDEGDADIDLGDEFAGYKHVINIATYGTNGLWDVEYDVANPQRKAEVHGHFLVYNPNGNRGGGISKSLPHH